MTQCPHCGQPLPADPIEAEVQRIERWCSEQRIPLVMGDCLRQCHAARYLGRSEKTLRNWSGAIPEVKVRGRVHIRISELARFVVGV